ncbi:MAG: ribonuclease III [Lachnospiraceae bacterium]|nr:ribonuclease III [Lachnospiraceae bacterium]
MKQKFGLQDKDINTYSPLTLAYIGDAVYDLVIRSGVVLKGNMPINKLHRESVRYVSAPAQAKIVSLIEGELTDEEAEVLRRGRAAKIHTKAKNASLSDYMTATAFEALIGYLYLTGRTQRILELVKLGVERFT